MRALIVAALLLAATLPAAQAVNCSVKGEIQETPDGTLWIVRDKTKVAIANWRSVQVCLIDVSKIRKVDQATMDANQMIGIFIVDGTFVKYVDDKTIYWMDNGKRRGIAGGWGLYKALGGDDDLKHSHVVSIESADWRKFIPQGPNITAPPSKPGGDGSSWFCTLDPNIPGGTACERM